MAFTKSRKTNQVAQIRSKRNEETGKDHQVIEILGSCFKSKSWDAQWFDVHGAVITKFPFASFRWSNNGKFLVYVAEHKAPKTESFYKFKKPNKSSDNKDDEPKPEPGHEFDYKEDWGEALDGIIHSVVCVLNIETDEVKVIEVPNKSLAEPFFIGEDGSQVGFIGYEEEPRRLGLIYCPIRKSYLYKYDINSSELTMIYGSEPVALRSVRPSNNGEKLVFLENSILGPHLKASKLMLIQDLKSSSNVIEVVGTSITGSHGLDALYIQDSLPTNCWTANNQQVVFSCRSYNTRKILAVNVDSREIFQVNPPFASGGTVLDLLDDVLVLSTCAINIKPTLVVGRLNTKELSITWVHNNGQSPNADDKISYSIDTIPSEGDKTPVYTILCSPSNFKSLSGPCVVLPHGGPHSGFVDSYMSTVVILAKLGFKSLLINYRGSAGFNEPYLNSLPGFVGDLDVKDMVSVMNHYVANKLIDRDQLVLWGGSHGGFLVAHLSGQCASLFDFKSCICRNPVTDLVGMLEQTDIPDWIFTEGLEPGKSLYDFEKPALDPNSSERLLKMSPIYYVDQVKVATLMMLGKKDRRVPLSQGMKWYKGLKARGVATRCILYDDKHDLYKVDVDADAFVNIMIWILTHWD